MPKTWQNLKNVTEWLTHSPTWIHKMLAHLKMNFVWCIDKNYYPSCWAAFNSRFLSRTKVFTYNNKKMFRKGQNNYVLNSKERVRKGKNSCANRLLDSKEEVLKGNDLFSGCFAICLELGLHRVHLLADLVSLLLDQLFYLVELPEQESYSTTWSSPTWSSRQTGGAGILILC